MKYIPNLLTILRIALVPVLILLLQNQLYTSAFYVFVLAGVTDGIDGFVAKQFNCVTRIGSILDPLADKLLLISAFVMLTIAGAFPFWLLIVAVFRDLVIVTGVMVLTLLYDRFEMKPIMSSKINTFLQIVLVTVTLVQKAELLSMNLLNQMLVWMVAATTIISGLQYVFQWILSDEHVAGKNQP